MSELYDLFDTYGLNGESTVVDLAGYTGTWAESLLSRHAVKEFHLFEPVLKFMSQCQVCLHKYPQVVYHQVAVCDHDGEVCIGMCDDSTGMFVKAGGPTIQAKAISVQTFLDTIPRFVNLIEINAEGVEYLILEHATASGDIKRFQNIQVQFHEVVPDFRARYEAIYVALSKTHVRTYNWFNGKTGIPVWSAWGLKMS